MKLDIDAVLHTLSLEEKLALCDGQNFWMTKDLSRHGLPALFMCDGPHGLRKQALSGGADMLGINDSLPATCFPAAVTSGASWDTALMERIGAAIGAEAHACGVGLVLGPGANLKRSPLCGRNFEYFSEDPVVTGEMAAGFIRGLAQNGTGASLKHFACNNQERDRLSSDSVIDERTLRELYLTGFEIAVKKGKPATLMCSYNKINGVHSSDNKTLLTDILREDWGFDGMVVTDWGAMCDRRAGFKAGCDLNMPGGSGYMEKECLAAVKTNALSEADIDNSARRVLRLMAQAAEALKEPADFDRDAHHMLAREAAASGAVLLKNEGLLPLAEDADVALIGAMAKLPRYQGAGSSHINPFRVVSPCEAMPDAAYAPGCTERGDTTDALIAAAVQAARAAGTAVVFAGLPDSYESEGFDREDLEMPAGHIRMIEAVAEANPNTVVVLCCGSAVECPWADKVRAILYMGLGGQAMGEAAADLLYGRVNPSGKLTESWPFRYADCVSSSYFGTRDAQYREGIYVGYRYYEKAGVPVRWPFGYGLSYTRFAYSALQADAGSASVTVTNIGSRPGAEVVQLYIAPPADGAYRPVRELKRFEKVFLQPGESKTVTFALDDRCFAVWQDGWRIPAGTYTVASGGLSAAVAVSGAALDLHRGDWYDAPVGAPSQAVWERMLGRKYTERVPVRGQFTMDDSLLELKEHSLVMKLLYLTVKRIVGKGFARADRTEDNPEYRMMLMFSVGGPLRSMQISGGIRGSLFQGLLDMANGHFFRGLGAMLKG